MQRLIVLVLIAFCAAVSAEAATRGLTVQLKTSEAKDAAVLEEVELYSKSYALVIGNDSYGAGWARLAQARNDARKIAKALRARGFDVTLKLDLKSSEMEKAFKDFFLDKGEDPDARLFVWYAGHGHTEDGEGYLVPVDGAAPNNRRKFLTTALSMRDFGKFVRYAESKHVFTIFDSCFAGTIFNVARSSDTPPQITRITTQPVRQFLTSGDAGQTVADNGSFADLFIEALEGKRRADPNADGYLTASELGVFLDTKVSNLTNNRQTPRYGKLQDRKYDKGDFVFRLASASPTRSAPPTAQADKETVFWQSIQNSQNQADFQAYLDQYPRGSFAALAKNRLARLAPQPRAPALPAPGESFADKAYKALKKAEPAWHENVSSDAEERNVVGQMEVVRYQVNQFDGLVRRFDEALGQVESGAVGGSRLRLEDGTVFDILHELKRLDARLGAGRCYALGPATVQYRIKKGRAYLDGLVEETFHAFRTMCGRAEKLIGDVRYRVDAAGLTRADKTASLGAPVRFIAVTPLQETRIARTNSNIREAPSPRAAKVGQLPTGQSINVTGRADVAGKTWYRVARAGGQSGFVLGSLLKTPAPPKQKNVTVTSLAPPTRTANDLRILIRKDLGVRSTKELDGATFCFYGTDASDDPIIDYFRRNKMKVSLINIESGRKAITFYDAGRCDIISGTTEWLNGAVAKMQRPSDHVILPERIR